MPCWECPPGRVLCFWRNMKLLLFISIRPTLPFRLTLPLGILGLAFICMALQSGVGHAQPWADAPETPDDPVLATFDGGMVRLSDVQREIRFLRKDERRFRQHEGMGLADQWRDWIHRVALRRIALPLAEAAGLTDDPWLREKARQAARDWALDRWRQRCYGLPLVLPDDEELASELPGEAKTVPPRLRLSHLFLAAEGDEALRRASEQLRVWRSEIKDLETFKRYAEDHSDSKSALKGGTLGFLRQGWLPKEAEEILYTLPAGSISEPIALRGGVHIFFVERNEPAQVMPKQREIDKLRNVKRKERLDACREQRLAESAVGAEATATGAGQEPTSLDDGVLTVGQWTLSAELLQRIYGRSDEAPSLTGQRLREREALYQLLLANQGLEPEERLYLDSLEANNVLGALIQSRRDTGLEPDVQELRAYYEARPDSFKTALAFSLWLAVAQVPEGHDPIAFLDAYEALAADLAAGRKTWPEVAAEASQGWKVERLERVHAFEVGTRYSPFLVSQLAPLPAGSFTGVIQDAADFYIVQVTDRQAPQRKSFAEVEAQLRRRLIKERQSQASAKLVAELLESAHFQWTDWGSNHLRRLSSTKPR